MGHLLQGKGKEHGAPTGGEGKEHGAPIVGER